MVPANGSSRDRQGLHRCTSVAHEDRKQTSVNTVKAENPEAFQHHAFFLLGKFEKYHVLILSPDNICQYLVNNPPFQRLPSPPTMHPIPCIIQTTRMLV